MQFVGAMLLRAVCYIAIAVFLYCHLDRSVMALDLIEDELQAIPYATTILAFPQASSGELSVMVWMALSVLAAKEALSAFIG